MVTATFTSEVGVPLVKRRLAIVIVGVERLRQAHLLVVTDATGDCRAILGLGQSGKKERGQDGDDRYDDQ